MLKRNNPQKYIVHIGTHKIHIVKKSSSGSYKLVSAQKLNNLETNNFSKKKTLVKINHFKIPSMANTG